VPALPFFSQQFSFVTLRLLNAEKEAGDLRNLVRQSEADMHEKDREAEKMIASIAPTEEDVQALRAHCTQCTQLEHKCAEESHQHRTKVQARIETKMSFSLSQKKVKFCFHER
jgi:DNA repair ATPase RecN